MIHSKYKINTYVVIDKGIKAPKGTETRWSQGHRWEFVGALPSMIYEGLMKWADYEYSVDYRNALVYVTGGKHTGLSKEEKTENKEWMFEHTRRLLELNNVEYSEDIDKSFDEIKALYL